MRTEHSNLTQCYDNVDWTSVSLPTANVDHAYHMRSSLSLPLDAESLRFSAGNTNITHGHFEVSATAPAGSTEAIVDVDAFYDSPEVFDNMTMCRIHDDTWDGRDTWGLSIFVWSFIFRQRQWLTKYSLQGSRGDMRAPPLRLHVHLRLPAASGIPVQLGWLTTFLPNFSHTLHNLTAAAFFELVSLQGSRGPILAEVCLSRYSITYGVLTGGLSTTVCQ